MAKAGSTEKVVREIRRHTRRRFSAEEKIRIVLEGLRGEDSIAARLAEKNGAWFDDRMDKLDCWADDRRRSLKADLEELDARIKETKREARSAPDLPIKLDLQRQLRQFEAKRNEAWKAYDETSRAVERKKDGLLDEISQRLSQKTEQEELFMIRWQLM